MLWFKKISPEEQKKLAFLLNNVQCLVRKNKTSGFQRLVMRKQVERILQLLGEPEAKEELVIKALAIIKDSWPFKQWRLNKLIYGRR